MIDEKKIAQYITEMADFLCKPNKLNVAFTSQIEIDYRRKLRYDIEERRRIFPAHKGYVEP